MTLQQIQGATVRSFRNNVPVRYAYGKM